MLKNRFILCFGKDWQESPTSNNHIMSLLAEKNTVIWFNSTATRAPSLVCAQDWRKIIRKIRENISGLKHIKDRLYVFTPLLAPFPKFQLIQEINRFILLVALRRFVKKFAASNIDIWIFYPLALELIKGIKRNLLIYYCTDQWSGFSYVDSKLMQAREAKLLQAADFVFTASQVLYRIKKEFNPRTFYMPHGVDFELFSAFGASHLPKPRDFEKVRPPIIGFYGLIQDWLDFELIAKIAKSHPEWSIALIGKVATDISEIRDYSNIYLLGEKPYKDLPNYSRLFDVAIIPYNVADKRMETVNPTKLLQYIACGLPVVSVDLPEVRNYSKVVYVASSHEEFIKNIEKALKENSQERRQIRQLMAKDETWQRRVEKISEIISNEANPDTMSGLGRI